MWLRPDSTRSQRRGHIDQCLEVRLSTLRDRRTNHRRYHAEKVDDNAGARVSEWGSRLRVAQYWRKRGCVAVVRGWGGMAWHWVRVRRGRRGLRGLRGRLATMWKHTLKDEQSVGRAFSRLIFFTFPFFSRICMCVYVCVLLDDIR